MLQTHIEDPYLGVFESDLLEIMQSQEKPDEAELELERLRTKVIGFSIQARSIEIASSEAYEEMHEYIRAVREKLQEDVHVSEKIRYMDELLPLIESRYKDCLADNRELLEKKAEYDTIHLALASLMAELGQGVPEYKFSASDPSASIAAETLLVEQKGELLDRRHAQEKIHKAIGDAMRKRRWGLVAQERFEDEGKRYLVSTYHVENGNVVQFRTSEDGEVDYGVSGVHTPGVPMNRRSIYDTQIKVCAQREAIFADIAALSGCPLDGERYRDDPSLEHVYEVELNEGVVPGAYARIVSEKKGVTGQGGSQGEAKAKYHTGDDDE